MKYYAKLKFENSNNPEATEKIEKAAAESIDYAVGYYEYAVSETNLNEDGFLDLLFVDGQNIDSSDEKEVTEEAQKNFDEKFVELINMEYPEVK